MKSSGFGPIRKKAAVQKGQALVVKAHQRAEDEGGQHGALAHTGQFPQKDEGNDDRQPYQKRVLQKLERALIDAAPFGEFADQSFGRQDQDSGLQLPSSKFSTKMVQWPVCHNYRRWQRNMA